MGFLDRLKHAWNAFSGKGNETYAYFNPKVDYGYSSYSRPDRVYMSRGNERSIVTAVYNRIAMDVASVAIKHVRLDENGRYTKEIKSSLNNCLTVEANKDQTARSFIQDVVLSLLDEGCIAVVPVDTDDDPEDGSFKIETIRTGKIIQWFPDDVELEVYNDRTGRRENIMMPKSAVSIIENPLYAVTNSPNSTLQRLIRKLNILDAIDEQSGSGKLDLIVQLPYVIKTQARREQAEIRRKDIEDQLNNSKYGIVYTDGAEKITQLNRPVENNLMKQVEYLTSMLFSQLGITLEILNGTAKEEDMLNYFNRTVEPIVAAIVDEMNRKFLSKTARSQHQAIKYFNDPFKLVPLSKLADIADKFTRNEIMSSNEIRQIIGFKPVDDPKADELRNKNLNPGEEQKFANTTGEGGNESDEYDPYSQVNPEEYGG